MPGDLLREWISNQRIDLHVLSALAKRFQVSFEALCIRCGECARVCETGAIRKGLACLGIDDLDEELVFVDVETLAEMALAGDPGAQDLRRAVGVDRLDVEAFLQLPSQGSAPSLAAEETQSQGQRLQADLRLVEVKNLLPVLVLVLIAEHKLQKRPGCKSIPPLKLRLLFSLKFPPKNFFLKIGNDSPLCHGETLSPRRRRIDAAAP